MLKPHKYLPSRLHGREVSLVTEGCRLCISSQIYFTTTPVAYSQKWQAGVHYRNK